jgi:YegS/Rv2252/BmrU family lipid kinase
MPRPESVRVIINTASGVGDKGETRRRVAEILAAGGVKADILLAQNGAEVGDLAREAVRDSCPVIVAGGGDGTANAVAAAVVGSDKILGVLPLGTLNHFARDLKIPFDLEGAAATIVAGHTTKVDVGEVNGRIFLNNSSLGLYPIIVHERKKQQRLGSGKWPAFVWAAITALRRYPFLHVKLSARGTSFDIRTPFVFVGNNEYVMERFQIGLRESLNRAVLSLYMAKRTGRLGLVRLALRALLGRLREDKDFLALTTKEVRIKTRHKILRAAFDGEVAAMETPLHYRIRPRALRVIVPPENE